METMKIRNSITMVLIMLMSTFAAIEISNTAQGSAIVLTDAIQVTEDSHNNRMVAIAADSAGNTHFVWSQNTQHLYYKMLNNRGQTLIDDTQISNPGSHRAWHPDIVVDHDDRVHIVWVDKSGTHEILYTLLDPSEDNQDGSAADALGIFSVIDDKSVAYNSQNRDWPAIAVDSQNNPHIVWEDSYEELDKFYQQPQIFYTMFEIEDATRTAEVAIGNTLLTPIIGYKEHPDIAIDADDFVQIVWDDTRGGKVEMVIPVDTSGSMNSAWADMCTVFYGGTFFSGGSYFPGLKPMLLTANMTVYETLYAIGGQMPVTTGNCATPYSTGGNGNEGPRTTPLGIIPGDDSGGMRKLNNIMFNGNSISISSDGGGLGSEAWGPSSTWACLSWRDSQGRLGNLADPPTPTDHRWNPNATRIVIPVSDENAYDGNSQDPNDIQSIEEAHDACVLAEVSPVPLWVSSSSSVGSEMRDLAECPNGFISTTTPRVCPGSTIRNTHAGGAMFSFPASSSSAAQMQELVNEMVKLSTNNSREIFMTVLDPYSLLERPSPESGWVKGDPGTKVVAGNSYQEDIGPSQDPLGYGHLVVVNDTRITLQDAYSLHPSIAIDTSGNTHLAWMDGRPYGFSLDVNYEIYYTRLRLRGTAAWDGVPEGLPSFGIRQITPSPISNLEGMDGLDPQRPEGANSHMPEILTDQFDNVHIAWLDNMNETQGEAVFYTRLNNTNEAYPDGFPLNSRASAIFDEWEIFEVSEWSSDKLGPNNMKDPLSGQPPAFTNDLGSGVHIAWSDKNKCNSENNGGKYTICYVHILTGIVDLNLNEFETFYHTIEPSQQTTFNFSISNPTPGPPELVADTYSVTMNGVPNNWTATLFFATNNTPIFESTPVFLRGGENLPLYMRVRAPTIYQANQDEIATISIIAESYKDPAIRDELITLTLMDVVHGINLDTSSYQVDVEQGETASFSITITNTGNVRDTFQFYDTSTTEGQEEWGLQFGWNVNFPTSKSLDPGVSSSQNLEINIPEDQDPGTFVLYLKGWSEGEPVLSLDRGTYDVLELWVNVSVKSSGNIIFNVEGLNTGYVLPGNCADYIIKVSKYYTAGYLIFTIQGGPEDRPSEISEQTWRHDHWTVELQFDDGTPSNGGLWPVGTYPVGVEVCSPHNATAGIGEALTVRANLEGSPRIRDSSLLVTNVFQEYELEATTQDTNLELYPGESFQLDTLIENEGNGPDRYDITINSIYDSEGNPDIWDIEIPRMLFEELGRDESQEIPIMVNVPQMTFAGQYTVKLDVLSEEEGQDGITRLRDVIELHIDVKESHDIRIEIDPAIESRIKTTAPGRVVRYTMNVSNFGNVADQPTLHNHTKIIDDWDQNPGMNSLSGWEVDFAILADFDTEYAIENPCVVLTVSEDPEPDQCFKTASGANPGTVTLPIMPAYTTLQIVAIVSIDPAAVLSDRELGIKVLSDSGSSEVDGDIDETPSWEDSCTLDANADGIPDNYHPNCDTNEQILELRLRAPDLKFAGIDGNEPRAEISNARASVGEMISVNVQIQNVGNIHATDVDIVLCVDQSISSIKKNGCHEDNIAYRQSIEAVMNQDTNPNDNPPTITLLYLVEAGSHDVVVVIDPENMIVESNEDNNFLLVQQEIGSNFGILDVGVEIVAQYSVPAIILSATVALMGVAGVVMYGRRMEAISRFNEKSSLISNINDEDMIF